MKRITLGSIGLVLAATALAGCGGSSDSGGGGNGAGGGGEGDTKYADGGTFTMSMAGDPGKLDPQSSASTSLFAVNQLGYDNLVSVDGKTGEIQSQLAKDWTAEGTTVTLTLTEGVTCADGSDFTATMAADNQAQSVAITQISSESAIAIKAAPGCTYWPSSIFLRATKPSSGA